MRMVILTCLFVLYLLGKWFIKHYIDTKCYFVVIKNDLEVKVRLVTKRAH